MGRSYYYFAASLPLLSFEGAPPKSVEGFLGDVQRLLEKQDFLHLEAILKGELDFKSGKASAVFQQLVEFKHQLSNEIAYFRATKHSKEPEKHVRGQYYRDPALASVIEDAARVTNPLEGEKVIDKAVWRFLDEISLGHYYNFESIVIYGLKLKILNRYKEIKSPKGKEALEEIKKVHFPEGMLSIKG